MQVMQDVYSPVLSEGPSNCPAMENGILGRHNSQWEREEATPLHCKPRKPHNHLN